MWIWCFGRKKHIWVFSGAFQLQGMIFTYYLTIDWGCGCLWKINGTDTTACSSKPAIRDAMARPNAEMEKRGSFLSLKIRSTRGPKLIIWSNEKKIFFANEDFRGTLEIQARHPQLLFCEEMLTARAQSRFSRRAALHFHQTWHCKTSLDPNYWGGLSQSSLVLLHRTAYLLLCAKGIEFMVAGQRTTKA